MDLSKYKYIQKYCEVEPKTEIKPDAEPGFEYTVSVKVKMPTILWGTGKTEEEALAHLDKLLNMYFFDK